MTECHVHLCQRPWNGKACTCTSPFPRQPANQFHSGGKGEEEAVPSSFTSVFFSSLSHSTGQTLLPPELGAGVLSPRAAEASLQSPSVTSTSREPALNLRERLQGSLMCVQQQYQKVKTDSSQKKISMACEILSNACSMHEPPFHYFCIHSAPSELLPCLLLTVVSMVYLLSCHSPVLLPLPHNH